MLIWEHLAVCCVWAIAVPMLYCLWGFTELCLAVPHCVLLAPVLLFWLHCQEC